MVVWLALVTSHFRSCNFLSSRLIYVEHVAVMHTPKCSTPFSPSFRMYFNLLTLVVCMTLIMKRAPVFRYRNLGIRCFKLLNVLSNLRELQSERSFQNCLYYSELQYANTSGFHSIPIFSMYFNMFTLLVSTTLFMRREPVLLYRNLGIGCFQLKQNGVATWNVQMKNLSNVQELERI